MRSPRAVEFDHELRFLLPAAEVEALLAALMPRLALGAWERPGVRRYVRTTYFDTPDLALSRASGAAGSRRVRIREYAEALGTGAPRLTGACWLEWKESVGTRRTKERVELEPGALAAVIAGEVDLGGAWTARRLDTLRPCLTTWYRRTSWSGEGGRLRLTVDDELLFACPVRPGLQPVRPIGQVARIAGRVVEAKWWGSAPGWLHPLLALGKDRVFPSKLQSGVRLLAGMRAEVAA